MWYEKTGNDTDIVLGCKVQIERNIKGFSFPVKMSEADKENVIGMVRQAAGNMGYLNFVRTDELDETAKADLYNNYFCGYQFLNSNDRTGFLLSKEEGIGVVINGNDHISVESIVPGSDVTGAYNEADRIAGEFEKNMDIAFSEKYGFLTSGIKNIGTGVCISVLAALPGVEKTAGALGILSRRIEKFDWQISPAQYGDIKEAGMYILRSNATLGVGEEDILDKARIVLGDVIKLERTCRDNICKKKRSIVEDQYYRSYAILKYARRIDENEAFNCLSWIRIGQDIIKDDEAALDYDRINLITHKIRRDYAEFPGRGKKNPSVLQQRALRTRRILRGDDAK